MEFPNEVNGNWNATGPIQIVASDMTIFKNKGKNWEWTLLVDTFNNDDKTAADLFGCHLVDALSLDLVLVGNGELNCVGIADDELCYRAVRV